MPKINKRRQMAAHLVQNRAHIITKENELKIAIKNLECAYHEIDYSGMPKGNTVGDGGMANTAEKLIEYRAALERIQYLKRIVFDAIESIGAGEPENLRGGIRKAVLCWTDNMYKLPWYKVDSPIDSERFLVDQRNKFLDNVLFGLGFMEVDV